MSTNSPYQFIRNGQLFVIPVGSSISEVPYQEQRITKPREFSVWVGGKVDERVAMQGDAPCSPPTLFRAVREDLTKFSPVEVTRSAFRKSGHAYVGVIDSRGKPFYFALDSRGISLRAAPVNDERAWKTFDRLMEAETETALQARRVAASEEMRSMRDELSEPMLVIKALPKKPKVDEAKKTPSTKASAKKAGAGGRTRYSYPQEKGGAKKPGAQPQPLIVEHDDSRHADPGELANQLGVSVRTLARCAKQLGREGFAKYMRSHLKRFAAKHRLDPDYWATLYNHLRAPDAEQTPVPS